MPLQVEWGPAVPGWEGESLGLPIPCSGSMQDQTLNPGDPRKDAREKACFVPFPPNDTTLRRNTEEPPQKAINKEGRKCGQSLANLLQDVGSALWEVADMDHFCRFPVRTV